MQFGALQLTLRACYTRPATETSNTDAFVEVDEVTLQGEVRRIFTGWMYASSPGLHGVEHPIYDLWLTDCKGGAQAAAEKPAEAAAADRRRPRPRRARSSARSRSSNRDSPCSSRRRFVNAISSMDASFTFAAIKISAKTN